MTIEDANIAEKIFGPDIAALKGKTVRKAPIRVKEDYVEIPPKLKVKHRNLVLCMDIMLVNGMPMLTSIYHSIHFLSLVPLINRMAPELYSCLNTIFHHYNDGGYSVKHIHCDQEFKPIMKEVEDTLDVKMNYTITDEHVPKAERNNQTIAERIHAMYHNLPYKTMPKLMLHYLAIVCVHQLNLFPAKGGVLAYLSLHVLVGGQNL